MAMMACDEFLLSPALLIEFTHKDILQETDWLL
jgi:hypothetical protein